MQVRLKPAGRPILVWVLAMVFLVLLMATLT